MLDKAFKLVNSKAKYSTPGSAFPLSLLSLGKGLVPDSTSEIPENYHLGHANQPMGHID